MTKSRSLHPPESAYEVRRPASQGSYLWCQSYPSSASFSTISSLLTLFSKFFSSFLRSTCSLSVSHKYLALEEVYLPFRAAFPSNPTHRKHTYGCFFTKHGSITLYAAQVHGLMRETILLWISIDYNSVCTDLHFELMPLHSPLLRQS